MNKVFVSLCLAFVSLLAPLVLFPQATSTWVFTGSDGRLHYKTDSNGNRILDYSYAGYKGGGVQLPVAPVAQTISPVSGDNTSHIQSAIDAVSASMPDCNRFRGRVLLTAAVYGGSRTLRFTGWGV